MTEGLGEVPRDFEQFCTLRQPAALGQIAEKLARDFLAPVARYTGFEPAAAAIDDIAGWIGKAASDEEKAWILVHGAFLAAVDEIMEDSGLHGEVKTSIDPEHLLQQGGHRLDLTEILVPPNFIDNPKRLPLLEPAEKALAAALEAIDVPGTEARSVAGRLPSHFVYALAKLWQDHPAGFEALQNLLEHPLARASRQERAWDLYRAFLDRDLDRPLFGEPITLRQLYQPLSAYWSEKPETTPKSPQGDERSIRHIVDLAETFNGWLEEPYNERTALRVLCGGPGSGKSSFVKIWASTPLGGEAPLPTILLPLQWLNSYDLEREVGIYTREHGFEHNPLDADFRPKKLLLILDGLDELDAADKRGREAASALITAAQKLVTQVQNNCKLRILLAGRTVIVEALQGELADPRQIFHVLGYALTKEEQHATDTDAIRWADETRLPQGERREAWWKAWQGLKGTETDGAPITVTENAQLAELSCQPLLNHLMAISGLETLGADVTINDIYARLLDKVRARVWGSGKQIPIADRLTPDEFQRVFESIGLALWQSGGGRTTTLETIAEIAKAERLEKQLAIVKEEKDSGALALLTAFYFRQVEGKGRESFELTHKSFGEYLAAKRILRLTEKLRSDLNGDHIDEEEGCKRWFGRTHGARITFEILGFLRGEFQSLGLDELKDLRAALIKIFDHNLGHGMPVKGDGSRAVRTHADNAELALLASIGAASRAILGKVENLPKEEQADAVRWQPAWTDTASERNRHNLDDLLRRLQHDTAGDPIPLHSLTGISIIGEAVQSSLASASLFVADAKLANLSFADLSFADLSGADLTRANLTRANLSAADLTRANLTRANLSRANLSRADLRHANLSDADLSGANLRGDGLFGPARGLTREQLLSARSLKGARLPEEFADLEEPL